VVEESGYREFDHTADWGIEVWASDWFGLLETAAKGMFSLLEAERVEGNRSEHIFSIDEDQAPEVILVEFLNELLFLSEKHHMAFDRFVFNSTGDKLQVVASGYPIRSQNKEIKAVTYYQLAVNESDAGLKTSIVFDV